MSNKLTPQNEGEDKILAVGKERLKLNAASSKLIDDIQFLQDRIQRMKQFRNPNKGTLQTYEDMLKSREAVLAWLEEQKKPTVGLEISHSA